MPIKKLSDPIYNVDIHFIINEPKEKVRKLLNKYDEYYDLSKFDSHWEKAGFAYTGCGWDNFIVFPYKKKTWDFTTILAHEALHVTFGVLRSKGIHLTCESEEAFCYYHSWLMQQFTEFYNQQRKK